MSLDRSLRSATALMKHRNVLTRAERIEYLAERGKFDKEAGDPIHLPKVGNRKLITGGKKKKGASEEGEDEAAAK